MSPLAPIAGGVLASLGVIYLALLARRPVTPPQARSDTARQQRFARNALTPILVNLAERALFWGFWVVALRVIGPEGNGQYAFAVNLLAYFGALIDFGLSTLAARDIAREPGDLGRVFGLTLALRARLLAVAIPAMIGVAAVYRATGSLSDEALLTTAILAAGLVLTAVNQAYASVYAAWERLARRAFVVVGTSAVTAGLGLLMLAAGLGVPGIALAGLASSTVTFIALARPVSFALLRRGWSTSWRELRPFAVAALPLMLNSLLATAFIQIDILILQAIQGTEVVGHYNAAYKFINGLNILPAAVVLAAFPLMAQTASDPAALVAWFTRAWQILATAAAVAVAFFFIYAGDVIEAFWGPDFLPQSATALSILIWFLPFSYLNGTLQYVLIAQDRQWSLMPAFLVTTIFNVVLNLALVPGFGFVAAAATTIASEAVLLAFLAWLLRRDAIMRAVVQPLGRPLLAAGGFVLVAWALRDVHWVAAAAGGIGAYLAVLTAVGGLSIATLRTLGAALANRSEPD